MPIITARTTQPKPISAAQLQGAIERGQSRMSTHSPATKVEYLEASHSLCLDFANNTTSLLSCQHYPEFASLPPTLLQQITVGLAGTALVLEEADLHVSVAGLLADCPQP